MPEDDNLETKLRNLTGAHAETRWLALRLDNDVKEIRMDLRTVRRTQREHTALLHDHSARLQEHSARFDSVDMQLRSLTRMVGNVLERLPEKPGNG